MAQIRLRHGALTPEEQAIVSAGFSRHSNEQAAPAFKKQSLSWVAYDGQKLIGALTADTLWDWMYIDELWVDEEQRGRGLGSALMNQAEEYAVSRDLVGVWLWTQSWQAADFYARLGFEEFTRFEDFPRGHQRVGLRKRLATLSAAC